MPQPLQTAQVTKEMTIGEIVSSNPEAIEPLSNAGVQCAGCGTRFDLTLENALSEKGLSSEKIEKVLHQINSTILEIRKDLDLDSSAPKTIYISSRAAEKVSGLMKKQIDAKALRFAALPGGCSGFSYSLGFEEKPSSNDLVVTEKGITFFIDKNMLPMLNGSRIDFVDSIQGSGFKINNPNAKATCGCGQSFS